MGGLDLLAGKLYNQIKLVKGLHMKLVKFALTLPLVAISVFLLAALSAQAGNFTWTGGGTPNADGSYNWQDDANWGKTDGSFPGVDKDGNPTTVDKAIFPQDTKAVVRMDKMYTVGSFDTTKTGLDLTIYGCGSNHLITASNLGTGSKLVLDNIGMTGHQITCAPGSLVRLQNAAYCANTWFVFFQAGSALEIVDNSFFDGQRMVSLAYAGTRLLIKNNSTLSAPQAISAGSSAETPTTWEILEGSRFYTGAKTDFICGGSITVSGKSTFETATGFSIGCGTTLTIDDSIVSSQGGITIGSNKDLQGDRVIFKGDNPVLRSFSALSLPDVSSKPAYTCAVNFDFLVPVAGFVESPIQLNTTTTSCLMYAARLRAWLKPSAFFNILPESPALKSDKQTVAQLTSANSGTSRAVIAFPEDGTVKPEVFAYLQGDGTSAATADANAVGLWVTIGTGEPAIRAVKESKGVANGVNTTVAHRMVTASTSVSQLANETGYTTRLSFYAGSEGVESSMSLISTQPVEAKASYSAEWTAGLIGYDYYCMFKLETLNAKGEVSYVENSPIVKFTTVDTTTYTWKAKDGVWDGNWSDPGHWDDDAGGDCFGYPATVDASAKFAAGTTARITFDAARSIRAIDLTADNLNVTFVNGGDGVDDTKLSVSGGSSGGFLCNGTGGSVTLDGVSVSASFWSNAGKARRTLAVVNGAKFRTNNGLRVQGSNVWLKVSGKSSVDVDQLFISGGGNYDGGIVVDDSDLVSDAIALGADNAAGKPCAIRFVGENPTWKPRGNLTVANNNPLRLEFDVPASGFAEPPIQIAKAGSVAFTASDKSPANVHVPVMALLASPVRANGSAYCPFAVCIGGFAVGNVTIEPVRHRADKLVWSEKDSDWTVADWIDDSKYVGDGLELRAMGAFVDANPGFQILVR